MAAFLAHLLPQRRSSKALLLSVLIFGLLTATMAYANIGDDVAEALTNIVAKIVIAVEKMLAFLLVVVTRIMIAAAQYNDFTNAPAVEKGWTIVRDLSNMFFIVILLVIAFGTIMRIQQYRFQQTLPRFIVWAVLINFSKFIAGIWIDFAQVITLTFVNAFRNTAEGNIVEAFGLRDMLQLVTSNSPIGNIGVGEIWAALLLSLALLIIANVVIISITVVFIFRIVILWLLIVLSPIAYLTRTFPNAVKYSDQWWTTFNKYVLTGPVLAFFVWLALTITATPGYDTLAGGIIPGEQERVIGSGISSLPANTLAAAISDISKSDRLLSFLLSISLFVSALIATQQLGVMGSGVTSGALRGIQRGALGALRWTVRRPGALGSWSARKIKAGRVGVLPLRWLKGVDLNPANFVRGVRQGMEQKRIDEELEGQREAGARARKFGGVRAAVLAGGTPQDFAREYMSGFMWNRGIQRLFMNPAKLAEKRRIEAVERDKKAESLEALASLPDPQVYMRNKLNEDIELHEQEVRVKDQQMNEGSEIDASIERQTKTRDDALEKNDDEKAKKAQAAIDELVQNKAKWEKDSEVNGAFWGIDRDKFQKKLDELRAEKTRVFGNEETGAKGMNAEEQYQESMKFIQKEYEDKVEERNRVAGGGITDEQKKQREAQKRNAEQKDYNAQYEELDLKNRLKFTTDPKQILALQAQLAELKTLRTTLKAWMTRLDNDKQRLTRDEYRAHQQELSATEKSEDEQFNQEEVNAEGKKTGRIMGDAVIEGLDKALTQHKLEVDAIATINQEKRQQFGSQAAAERQAAVDLKDKAMDAAKWVFQDFSARAAGRASSAMAAKNVDTENEYELIQLYKSAMNNDDKALAEAVLRESAAVGHLNELVNAEGFTANQEGLNAFVNKTLVGKLGMDRQIAYGIQNDASEIAQRINHWTFAQSVGVKSGQFYQRSPYEQGLRTAVEMSKRDPEGIVRQSNRLGYGGEDRFGKFHISEAGLHMIAKGYKSISSQFGRGRYNRSAAMKLVTPETFGRLQQLIYTDLVDNKRLYREFLNQLQAYAAGSAESVGAESRAVSRILGHSIPHDTPNIG